MEQNQFAKPQAERAVTFDAGLQAHFRRVYNMMAGGLVVTGLIAWFTAHTPALMQLFYGTPLQWVVIFAPLFIIFFGLTPAKAQRMSFGAVTGLYFLITALFGISLAYIFLVYSGQSIARVFFITAGMFAGMSIVGYTTRRDLSGMGSLMIMGLIGILIASVVNIFMQSAMMQFVVSVIGVVVFTGLIAWDTQYIKESYRASISRESASKMAVMGALSLYLNFINLFMMLLRLFGSSRN
ncbi:MAG: Bax inhibitor-1/YccA family protein [Alphaproteobacteria bacterium]